MEFVVRRAPAVPNKTDVNPRGRGLAVTNSIIVKKILFSNISGTGIKSTTILATESPRKAATDSTIISKIRSVSDIKNNLRFVIYKLCVFFRNSSVELAGGSQSNELERTEESLREKEASK